MGVIAIFAAWMESQKIVGLGGEASSVTGMESHQTDFWEEKLVPSQGWRVKRLDGWKEKKVLPKGWSASRLKG